MAVGLGRTEHCQDFFFPLYVSLFLFWVGVHCKSRGWTGQDGEMNVIWMHDVKYTKN